MKQSLEDSDLLAPGRIALGIEYMGAAYCGWQRQPTVDSVQKRVEDALEKILLHKVHASCAGRTDAAVHATAQVVHLDSQVTRPVKAYTRGMNTLMPKDIAITWVRPVSDDFHARYSATARRYRYIIYNNALRSGIFHAGVTHAYRPLNEKLMHQSAQCLLGKHDFTTFRASGCQAKTPIRNVHHINIYRQQEYIIVDIKANAFLHHMVRNIVGSLTTVGCGDKPVSFIADLLSAKDRTKASTTAKPNGLYLVAVDYDEKFGLGETPLGPLFLHN